MSSPQLGNHDPRVPTLLPSTQDTVGVTLPATEVTAGPVAEGGSWVVLTSHKRRHQNLVYVIIACITVTLV